MGDESRTVSPYFSTTRRGFRLWHPLKETLRLQTIVYSQLRKGQWESRQRFSIPQHGRTERISEPFACKR